MGFSAVSLVSGKALLLFVIGMLMMLHLVYPSVIYQHHKKSREMNSKVSNDEYLETPHLSRKRLGEIWNGRDETVDFPRSTDVHNATVPKRFKREAVNSNTTKQQSNSTRNSYNTGQSQNEVLMNGNGDKLEWKIDVHVARHNARSGISTNLKQALEHTKIPRSIEHANGVTQENDYLKPDDGLGMKLTVEGRGGESSSFIDLRKAWASVGLFLQNFFGENIEQNLENNTDVALMPSDTKLQTSSPQRVDGLQLINSTVSNQTKLQDRSPHPPEDSFLSVGTQKNSDSSQFTAETTEIGSISETEISEEGFVEVEQGKLLTSQELGEDLNALEDTEDRMEHEPNTNERNVEPRFFFGFSNRGSGDSETPTTESNVGTRRREGRFIFGLFRPRPTPAPDAKESGSGDNSEDNVDPSRSFRVELDKQLSNRKLFQENISDILDDKNFNKTLGTLSRIGERLFSEVFEVGSGDSRALVGNHSDEEYTASPSVKPTSLNGSEYVSDPIEKTQITSQDYFLETFTESYSLEVHDAYERTNISDYYDGFDVQVSQSDRAVNHSEYDLEDEIVLFLPVEDTAKETTEIPETTQQLDARFFGGLFSEGSGDEEPFSWRKTENESQTLFPISELLFSEVNSTGKNNSVLGPSYDYEILDVSCLPEEVTFTTGSASNTDEANYTEASPETTFLFLENIQEINSEYVSPQATAQPEKVHSDSYIIDYKPLSTEYDSNEHTTIFVTSFKNDYPDLNDKLSSGNVAFSTGEDDVSNKTNESAVPREPRRGARLLDDYYGCYDPECSENDSTYKNDNASLSVDEALSEELDSRSLSSIDINDSLAFKSQTFPAFTGNVESLEPLTSFTSESVTLTSIPVAASNKGSNNETYGFHLYDSETYSDFHLSEVVTATTKAQYVMRGSSTHELIERNLSSTTEDFTDLLDSETRYSTTSRPHQTRRCKASWQCNEKLNERCLNGSTCGCGRSFVRHPTTERCEAATAMVEAVLRFSGESYHEDLKNHTTERYQKTMEAAKDTMKTLLQENAELASTVADIEVTGFKPGSLVVTWNLIIPADGNESMDVIVEKVDHGLKAALDSPSVLQKLPFKSFNVDVLQVYQSAIDPCESSSLNYCSDNAICIRDLSVMRGFSCQCKDGFSDLSQNLDYPGEICRATCVPGYCGEHGICEITEGSIKCNCQGWFLGDRCQLSGVVMVGSGSTALILLLIVGLMACVVWRYKRSSAYGNDVEERFQRTNEYGMDRKCTKALEDVLPMEETGAVPSRFLYLDSTPNPKFLEPKFPAITVTSPTISDVSTYFSDSTFDSLKL